MTRSGVLLFAAMCVIWGIPYLMIRVAVRELAPLIAEVGPTRATVITYINPAVAALLGVTLLNERLTTGMVIGFVLVVGGRFLATGKSPEIVPEP